MQPKPFVFHLTPGEMAELQSPVGAGGQQTFHTMLLDQLAVGAGDIALDDSQLGQLIRYMTQYGHGGFQTRLRNAFSRSLRELLGF